jgi:hypothetical protein
MSDLTRAEAIETLTEHLDHWKRLLSEGVCTKDEGEKTINALEFAIESIKVDRAYDLAYEKVDFIEIPEGATNGDILNKVFPNLMIRIDSKWWNSPYRKEQE